MIFNIKVYILLKSAAKMEQRCRTHVALLWTRVPNKARCRKYWAQRM